MFVVDTSVWVSRLIDSDSHHESSRRWLEQQTGAGKSLAMPAIAPAEIAAALAQRIGRPDLASRAVSLVIRLPNTRLVPVDEELAALAASMAADLRIGGSDALYVALAKRLSVPLVTWDRLQRTRGGVAIAAYTPTSVPAQGQEAVAASDETLPAILVSYRGAIEAALRTALDGAGPIHDVLRYAMGWADAEGNPVSAQRGKAVRPSLCLFACDAVGGSVEQALPAAVSLELIHSFSLIHDDVQDRDETRHHRPTVWSVWGEAKALDAGNTIRVVADLALQKLTAAGVPVATAFEAASILNSASLELVQGQYLDVSFEERVDVGLHEYLQMVSMKTGALIHASLTLGAMLGACEPHTVLAFTQFGKSLGAAFQISDDVLGIWGDEASTGKPVGSDIRRKKKSLPVVFAMSRSRAAARERLLAVYEHETVSDADVAAVLEIMDDLGSREYAQSLAEERRDEALDALAGAEISPEGRRHAEEIGGFLVNRSF